MVVLEIIYVMLLMYFKWVSFMKKFIVDVYIVSEVMLCFSVDDCVVVDIMVKVVVVNGGKVDVNLV